MHRDLAARNILLHEDGTAKVDMMIGLMFIFQ